MRKKGIVLIEIIMIIVLLTVVIVGITSYIMESLRYNVSMMNSDKALYMAQAGVMSVISDYQIDNIVTAPLYSVNVNSPSEFYYSIESNSNFLIIDGSLCKANGRVINHWPLQNISSTTPVVLDHVTITWDFPANLMSMKLGNQFIFKNGSLSSPALINNINGYSGTIPLTIPAGTSYLGPNDQYMHFDANIPAGITVSVVFNFSDGTAYSKTLVKSGNTTNSEFTIKATGKILAGIAPIRRRTLLVTYDIGTQKITSWQETQSHIMQ